MVLTLRSVSWLSFFAAILAAWWMLYAMSASMGLTIWGFPADMMNGPQSGAARPPAPQAMGQMAGMTRFWPLFWMWGLMMGAMMLPTMVPTLRTYEALIKGANGTRAGWVGVLSGYFLAWIGFAAVLAALQAVLWSAGAIGMMGMAVSLWASAALLLMVGLFQFTPFKEVCHGICLAPMTYFMGYWKTGLVGGVRMGLGLGVYCVGCCWGFMILGFAGGTMNLIWMFLATLAMVLEKLPSVGRHVIRPLGALLIAMAIGISAMAADLI